MSEERAQQLIQQMQMLETYFSGLTQREETLHSVSRDTAGTIESIKSISQKPESEALVPIGSRTFIATKVSSDSKIVLDIGAGVAVERDSSSTINYLEAHIRSVHVALDDIAAKKQDTLSQLKQCKVQVNQLMQSTSKSG